MAGSAMLCRLSESRTAGPAVPQQAADERRYTRIKTPIRVHPRPSAAARHSRAYAVGNL